MTFLCAEDIEDNRSSALRRAGLPHHHRGMIRSRKFAGKASAKLSAKAEIAASARGRVSVVAPPSFRRERALMKRGVWPVAGCDEAGRGPLAGPVVAAAVIFDRRRVRKGIHDSKRLSAGARVAHNG